MAAAAVEAQRAAEPAVDSYPNHVEVAIAHIIKDVGTAFYIIKIGTPDGREWCDLRATFPHFVLSFLSVSHLCSRLSRLSRFFLTLWSGYDFKGPFLPLTVSSLSSPLFSFPLIFYSLCLTTFSLVVVDLISMFSFWLIFAHFFSLLSLSLGRAVGRRFSQVNGAKRL